jgi:hypothetical protein
MPLNNPGFQWWAVPTVFDLLPSIQQPPRAGLAPGRLARSAFTLRLRQCGDERILPLDLLGRGATLTARLGLSAPALRRLGCHRALRQPPRAYSTE